MGKNSKASFPLNHHDIWNHQWTNHKTVKFTKKYTQVYVDTNSNNFSVGIFGMLR